ncbi:glutaredoxin family protein [Aquabacterium sp. A3]|uniref:glutaredoxin family protein n=1 Tax=Aquabacterium sp. A3 TaxID=3132829 RepID=UPI00311A146D
MRMARCTTNRLLHLSVLALLLGAAPAWALYKVVGPDGKVTYTDRPPAAGAPQPVSTIGASTSGTGANLAGLPYEVRQAAQRFPVQFYTTSPCEPCESARQFLSEQGVPYVEFTVTEDADLQAFRQQFKADGLPVLRVGSKTMTGFNSQEWLSYLKAAGYPANTALPSTYRQAAPRPWRGTSAGNAGRDTNTPREQAPDSAPSVAPPPGIRF